MISAAFHKAHIYLYQTQEYEIWLVYRNHCSVESFSSLSRVLCMKSRFTLFIPFPFSEYRCSVLVSSCCLVLMYYSRLSFQVLCYNIKWIQLYISNFFVLPFPAFFLARNCSVCLVRSSGLEETVIPCGSCECAVRHTADAAVAFASIRSRGAAQVVIHHIRTISYQIHGISY